MNELYQLKSSALPDSVRVAGFRGTEGISRLYELEIYLVLLSTDAVDLDLADVVAAKATLQIDRDDGRPPFVFHGIVAGFELVHEFTEYGLFRATLVPQLWHLTQTFHSRIWTHKSIPDIIKEVLEDGGLSGDDYALKLIQNFKPEEHVCQYGESNFDFISRWMEREGMYYWFEQGDSSEKLVIADGTSFAAALSSKPTRYVATSAGAVVTGEALNTFTCRHRALPASVKYKDYDYTKPTLDVSGTAPMSKVGMGEISVYGARFFTPDEGKRLAKLRSEEYLARQVLYRGKGTALYLRAGYTFTLEDHPRSAFDMDYLVTEAEHTGNQSINTAELHALTGIERDDRYHVEVTAIPKSVQFRAESKTAWPRIYGYENGTICGPAESEYAQIDDHGRYNVKFKFDESALKNGKASTFVRMMQPHGGSPEGFHFPLRKNTEVLFTFLGGDPDRPVIAGVVNDTTNPSPVTSANHTKNVIQTGGSNRLEIEDQAGQQRVTLSTPHAKTHLLMGDPQDGHEFIARTEGNSLHHTDVNHDQYVGSNCTINIVVNQTETIGGEVTQTVTGDVTEVHSADHSHTTTGNHEEKTGGNHTKKVTGTHEESNEADKKVTIAGCWKNLTSGVTDWTFEAAKNETVAGVAFNKFLGLKIEFVGGAEIGTTVGAKIDNVAGANIEIIGGADIGILGGIKLDVVAGANIELVGGVDVGIVAGAKIDGVLGVETGFGPAENEMKAIKNELHGAKKALAGLQQATRGLASIQCGAESASHGMKSVAAGLNNSAAGLHMME
jgi:type VI secretion system secreted protein VgrG